MQKNEVILKLQNNDNNINQQIENQDPQAIEIYNMFI